MSSWILKEYDQKYFFKQYAGLPQGQKKSEIRKSPEKIRVFEKMSRKVKKFDKILKTSDIFSSILLNSLFSKAFKW